MKLANVRWGQEEVGMKSDEVSRAPSLTCSGQMMKEEFMLHEVIKMTARRSRKGAEPKGGMI
jgi:hypothetical protein